MTDARLASIKAAIEDKLPDHMAYALVLIPFGSTEEESTGHVVTNGNLKDVPRTLRTAADSVERSNP